MNLKTVLFIAIFLIVFGCLVYFWGTVVTYFIFAEIFFIMGILFKVKTHLYDKFIQFINEPMYELLKEKNNVFYLKNKKTNILSNFIIALFFLFLGFQNIYIASGEKLAFSIKQLLVLGVVVFIFVIVICYLCYLILKKSEDYAEYVTWSVFLAIAIVITIIAMIGIYFVIKY